MFNEYPYINIEDLNLDYLLKKLKQMESTLTNFINFNAIKYADPIEWKITTQYQSNTVVIDNTNHIAYLSTQPVPSGVLLSDTDYWTVILDLRLFYDAIGNLNNLDTTARDTLVNAINEVFEIANGLNIFVTPQMFGAKGDGITDDTQSMADCLNSGANFVYIPAGVYNVKSIKAPNMKNMTIFAYGAKLNMIDTDLDSITNALDTFVLCNFVDNEPDTLNYNNGYINIYGLEVDANADEAIFTQTAIAPTLLQCITLYNYKKAYFKDVYVHHTMSGGGIACRNCDESIFEDCRAYEIGYAAFNYSSLIPGSNYSWDALGNMSVVYNGGYVYGMNTKITYRNCYFERISGCSMYGLETKTLVAENNTIIDNNGYCIEDAVLGSSAIRDNTEYTRIIKNNTYENSGTVYSWSATMLATETLNVEICGNSINNLFGNISSKWITDRILIRLYDSNSQGKVVSKFENNVVDYATIFTHLAPTTGYAGALYLCNGYHIFKNNTILQNNSSGDLKGALLSGSILSRFDISDNYIKGYFVDSPIQFASANGTSNYKKIITILRNVFQNLGSYTGSYFLHAAIRISSANDYILRVEDNENDTDYLLAILQMPVDTAIIRGNHNLADKLMVSDATFNAALYLIISNIYNSVGNPYESGIVLDSKSIVDNNINLA